MEYVKMFTQCAVCRAEIPVTLGKNGRVYERKFCGDKCAGNDCYRNNAADRSRRVREHYRKIKTRTVKCEVCGRSFESTDRKRSICGDTCRRTRARWASSQTQHRRRAAASYLVTPRDLARLLDRHRGCCAYCAAPATEWDHVVPLRRGGQHSIGNLLPACQKCNRAKTDKLLIEWRAGRKRRAA